MSDTCERSPGRESQDFFFASFIRRRRVVGVARGSAAVERRVVGLVEQPRPTPAGRQVGVGDEGPAERRRIDQSGVQKALGLGEVVVAGTHQHPWEGGPQRGPEVVGQLGPASPVGLGQVQERHPTGSGLGRDVQPHRKPGRVVEAVEDAQWRDPEADVLCVPGADHGVEHLERQAGAVDQRAAVLVGAVVALRGHELVQQVAVRAVDLDQVETGLAGVERGPTVVLDHAGDLLEGEGTGGRAVHPRRQAVLAADAGAVAVGQRARRHGKGAVVEGLVRHPADVPELGGDPAAGVVDGVGDPPPAGYLLGAVDAGSVHVALPLGGDLGALGHDQAGSGALGVVLEHQVVGNVAGRGRPRSGSAAP